MDPRLVAFYRWMYGWGTRRLVAWARCHTISSELASRVEEVRVSGVFDPDFYAQRYPEVVGVGKGLMDHYVRFGIWENRDPGPLFSCAHYLNQVGEETSMPAILDFLLCGDATGRSPNWLFDTTWYRQRYIRDEGRRHTALFHYLAEYRKNDLWTHPLFHSSWFAERYARLIPRRTSPLAFYLSAEDTSRLMPNPLFDADWYLRHYAIESDEPLRHYMEYGERMGLAPHPFVSGELLSILAEEH